MHINTREMLARGRFSANIHLQTSISESDMQDPVQYRFQWVPNSVSQCTSVPWNWLVITETALLIEVELRDTVRDTLARATIVREKRWGSVSLILGLAKSVPIPSIADGFTGASRQVFAYMGWRSHMSMTQCRTDHKNSFALLDEWIFDDLGTYSIELESTVQRPRSSLWSTNSMPRSTPGFSVSTVWVFLTYQKEQKPRKTAGDYPSPSRSWIRLKRPR